MIVIYVYSYVHISMYSIFTFLLSQIDNAPIFYLDSFEQGIELSNQFRLILALISPYNEQYHMHSSLYSIVVEIPYLNRILYH